MNELKCSAAVKLAGFKSAMDVVNLAGVSRPALYVDFDSRFSLRKRPKFIASLRKALDEKHRQDRVRMELAIAKIMNNEQIG